MKKQNSKASKFLKKVPLKLSRFDSSTYLPLINPQNNSLLPAFDKNVEIQKSELPKFQVIGMFRNKIFIIINPDIRIIGFVDQHAIHQRIRYQYFINCLQDSERCQKFMKKYIEKPNKPPSNVLEETVNHLLFIKKVQPKFHHNFPLKKWGFTLFLHSDAVYLKSYQIILGKKLQQGILKAISQEIIQNLENENKNIPRTLDHIIAETSCKAAIKFNDEICLQWCYQILFNISLCDFPWYCVHGRPTIHFNRIPEHFLVDQQQIEYTL